MLVFGDRVRRAAPEMLLEAIRTDLAAAEAEALWILRHERLVRALIEAGRLAQGLADAAFEARGLDAPDAPADAAMVLARRIAERVLLSFSARERGSAPDGDLDADLAQAPPGPTELSLKTPEGYAFYALYPETYGLAAMDLPPAASVLGLRSIGTSLAAIVAAASKAKTLVTARPCGHPFARELKLSEARLAQLSGAEATAVVDEGPGLSGSSFGAAAEALVRAGADPQRLWFFPSHLGGPGAQASRCHRARWMRTRKRWTGFEDEILAGPRPLTGWFADLVGPPVEPLVDLSGGRWRDLRGGARPPVQPQQERRKYLLHTDAGEFLLKFCGLTRESCGKLSRARALHAAGFTPEPLALRHGFLLERWRSDTRPLDPQSGDRARLLGRLADYLDYRASHFPAEAQDGASPAELIEMTAFNAGRLLGDAYAEKALARLEPLRAAPLRPMRIDGRLHAWEWLEAADGTWLKTDALDHDDGHDLVGCQDVAWDIAGAAVEFDLDAREVRRLAARLSRDEGLVEAMRISYLAFQGGAWSLAAIPAPPADQPAIAAMVERYRRQLHAALA